MDNRHDYHKSILQKYFHNVKKIKSDREFKSCDNLILNATQFNSNSTTGILVIPGIWYPREAYYKLCSGLHKRFNVVVYDQRSHCLSQGNFNIDKMIQDLIGVTEQYVRDNHIKELYLVGHSLGGYLSFIASSKGLPVEVKGQILLAPPISFKPLLKTMPEHLGLPIVYLLNLFKTIIPKYRSKIYKEYVSFNYFDFKKNPYYFCLRSDNPNNIIKELKFADELSIFASNIHIHTLFIWGDNDRVLKIKNDFPLYYTEFIEKNIKLSKCLYLKLLKKMSHHFNYNDKNFIQISGDNNVILNDIFSFIE